MCLVEQDWQSQPVAGVHQQTALLLAGQTQRVLYSTALAIVSLRMKIKLRNVCCQRQCKKLAKLVGRRRNIRKGNNELEQNGRDIRHSR